MKTFLTKLFVLSMILTLHSCALKPIVSTYDYQLNKTDSVDLDSLGDGKVLIYNGASFLHTIDNTARLNMWINDAPMGQVRASEYEIIDLETGTYEFMLYHLDVFRFKTAHTVELNEETKVIRIEPTVTSNKLTITNLLPMRIDEFKYVEER